MQEAAGKKNTRVVTTISTKSKKTPWEWLPWRRGVILGNIAIAMVDKKETK
jgi:hypothetical protein